MKHPIATLAVLAALIAPAAAQQFPLTLPASTVYGRLGASSGPGQAIPFATLKDRLLGTAGPGLFTSLGATGQSYFGPIAAGGDKRVAISGAFSKVTATGNQNLTLISNDAFANNPLALSAQVIGSATSGLRQGEIQVSEFGLATYRTLALQPLGGSVSIGLPSGTVPSALLDVRGTTQLVDPAFIAYLPAILWGTSRAQIGNVYSSTNQAALNINQVAPLTSDAYPAYEAAALFISTRTSDPSNVNIHDNTPADFRGIIASTNPNGRVWSFFTQATIEAGGAGTAIGHENSIQNFSSTPAATQPESANQTTNISVSTEGITATAGMYFQTAGPGWHNGIWMNPASLSGTAGTYFINLVGKWTVAKTGFTDIGGSTLTAHPLGVYAESGGGFAIGIRGRASDGVGRITFYSNDLVTTYAQLFSNSASQLVTATTFIPSDDGARNNGGASNAWLGVYARNLVLNGSTSGSVTVKPPAIAGANTLTLPAGTTDFSATGGTSQVVKQTSAGGAFTVARLACADLSDSGAGCGVTPSIILIKQSVDFNVGNADTVFTIALPAGYTRYVVNSVRISGASGTLTTATAGLFTAAAGAGTAIVTGASAITVSTASESTNNNTQSMTVNNQQTEGYNAASLYFRVGTAQGSAATGTVTIAILLLS